MKWLALLLAATWAASAPSATAADLSALIADREAVERVYYNHRTGEKPPFEKALTRRLLRQLVMRDLAKETALKQHYGVSVTDAQVAAEVTRINSTTRAPETLIELKAALADDPVRFARVVARPIVVERLLRERFQNDDALHASPRQEAENLRTALLAARDGTHGVPKQVELLRASRAGDFSEANWRLNRRTIDRPALSGERVTAEKSREHFLDELSRDLQQVLREQLKAAGDVTAVIETPDSFLLFVAKVKTDAELVSASIRIPKRDYDEWVEAQTASQP